MPVNYDAYGWQVSKISRIIFYNVPKIMSMKHIFKPLSKSLAKSLKAL